MRITLFEKLFVYIVLCIVTISSLFNLYEGREKIKSKIFPNIDKINDASENDSKWAELLVNEGGYILHFRHAERDRWIDVKTYDALDSHVNNKDENKTRFPENDYFEKAVCLNERGKVQARAMAEHLTYNKFPIGYVISSPSCRARQTAEIVFGKYDAVDVNLIHTGPYKENKKTRTEKLKKLYLSLPTKRGTNTIVSSHGNVIHNDMFINDVWELADVERGFTVEQGGFYVISKQNDKLKL